MVTSACLSWAPPLTQPLGQARTSTKSKSHLFLFSFWTRFWMLRKPLAMANFNSVFPSFSRLTSLKSAFFKVLYVSVSISSPYRVLAKYLKPKLTQLVHNTNARNHKKNKHWIWMDQINTFRNLYIPKILTSLVQIPSPKTPKSNSSDLESQNLDSGCA